MQKTGLIGKIKNLISFCWHNEQLMYIFIGGCTTLVNVISYWILSLVTDWGSIPRNIISVSMAILFAFFTNKLLVFRSKSETFGQWAAEFVKFVGARLSTMVVEVGGVWLLYDVIGIPDMISKIATQFIVLVVNYFISKFFVFRKGTEHASGL